MFARRGGGGRESDGGGFNETLFGYFLNREGEWFKGIWNGILPL